MKDTTERHFKIAGMFSFVDGFKDLFASAPRHRDGLNEFTKFYYNKPYHDLASYKAWLNNTCEGRKKKREMHMKHQRNSFNKLTQRTV